MSIAALSDIKRLNAPQSSPKLKNPPPKDATEAKTLPGSHQKGTIKAEKQNKTKTGWHQDMDEQNTSCYT